MQDDYITLAVADKELQNRYSVWTSFQEFTRHAYNWTQNDLLDHNGIGTMSIEAIRSDVDELTVRAFQLRKANKVRS